MNIFIASRASLVLPVVALSGALLCCMFRTSGADDFSTAGASRPHEDMPDQGDPIVRIKDAIDKCDADEFMHANSFIFRSAAASDAMAYIARQWNLSRDNSIASGDCLHQPLARTYIADTLAEGYANGMRAGIDLQSVRVHLRTHLNSNNRTVADVAIAGLSAIAESEDLELFEKIARTPNDSRRTGAIQALASLCSPKAKGMLDELEAMPGNKDVIAIRSKMAIMRDARCQRGHGTAKTPA